MITVAILINGNPIAARSAVNIEECASGYHKYKLDDGKTLLHRREDGAVKLAIEMLKSIKEVGVKPPNNQAQAQPPTVKPERNQKEQ
jgi:hypothetical protein